MHTHADFFLTWIFPLLITIRHLIQGWEENVCMLAQVKVWGRQGVEGSWGALYVDLCGLNFFPEQKLFSYNYNSLFHLKCDHLGGELNVASIIFLSRISFPPYDGYWYYIIAKCNCVSSSLQPVLWRWSCLCLRSWPLQTLRPEILIAREDCHHSRHLAWITVIINSWMLIGSP